jgi:hypothetical protein
MILVIFNEINVITKTKKISLAKNLFINYFYVKLFSIDIDKK